MIVVSVVKDISLYCQCVRENRYLAGADFVCYDNNIKNLTIPVRYNAFLNTWKYSHEEWFLFCHEDFEVLEPLSDLLQKLPKDCIYGVCGQSIKKGNLGYQLNSNKDRSQLEFRGKPISKPTVVDTLDCCCLIVHSSLVNRYGLRFDENLSWDLYAEDFCISASEQYGIQTCVIPLRTYHHSYGNVQPRFLDQLAYLRNKFHSASRVYATTTAYSIGGDPILLPQIDNSLRHQQCTRLRHLFYKKYSHSGMLLIKVLGIPVVRKQVYRVNDWLGGGQ